jgi:hypothetical protein
MFFSIITILPGWVQGGGKRFDPELNGENMPVPIAGLA